MIFEEVETMAWKLRLYLEDGSSFIDDDDYETEEDDENIDLNEEDTEAEETSETDGCAGIGNCLCP